MPLGHILKREKPPLPRNVIGPEIKRLRLAAQPDISQEDLCGRLAKFGVVLTRPQIAKIEGGRRPVFDYEVVAFAKALKTPISRLFDARFTA